MNSTPADIPDPNDRWILEQRGPRNEVDLRRPYAYLVEPERTREGRVEDVATIFLTNKECPFRCLMCDLWRNTTEERAPAGAVVGQIEWALGKMPPARHLKLYNSGNFFDESAVPAHDRRLMAPFLEPFETVIVECHPRMVDRRCADFADSIRPNFEVAMGLETVDPTVLPRLNKRMTLEHFERATRFLLEHDIAVRAFILLKTPFQDETEGVDWAQRSIEYAFSIGVECCAVIPTRAGNGAMEVLQQRGAFSPPTLASMEEALEQGIRLGRGRVFLDLWDIDTFCPCPKCGPERAERLQDMNLTQSVPPRVTCDCGT